MNNLLHVELRGGVGNEEVKKFKAIAVKLKKELGELRDKVRGCG